MKRAKKNAMGVGNEEWRRRQIILPETLVERLFEWHGGQSTAIYALASSGMRGLVSLSMLDAAIVELEKEKKSARGRRRTELNAVLGGAQEARTYWREHSAKEAGVDVDEYDYDTTDYGLSADDEASIHTRSG